MKNLLIILSLFISGLLTGQQKLNQFTWDDPVVFKNSGNPFVRSYGELSDSLSSLTDDKIDFYFHNGEYFAVQSWADYFNWFTTKYWYRFAISSDVYRFHYLTGNNIEMMRFLNNECVSESIHLSPAVARIEWENVDQLQDRRQRRTKAVAFSESSFEKENKVLISRKKRDEVIAIRKAEFKQTQSQRDLSRMQSTYKTSRSSSLSSTNTPNTPSATSTSGNTSSTKGLRKN